MEGLSFDNVLSQEEVADLFGSNNEETSPKEEEGLDNNENENKDTTEVIDVESLFSAENDPESVGSEENKEKEDTSSDEAEDSSPNNVFSSIAKAFKEEGILPNLEEDAKIETADDFAEVMREHIKDMLTEEQQRISRALDAGIETTEIQNYEKIIGYLDSISEESIKDESDKGENLRKQLIFQDFINRGYSKERAEREVKKSIDGGTDIEDAMEALSSNSEYFKGKYEEMIEDAERKKKEYIENQKKKAEKLKKEILNTETVFGDIKLDKATRQKVFDSITKPVYKDPKTGRVYTAVQKYELDNGSEFMKNLGLLYTLTDGFKNIDGLVKGKVKKEVKKGLKNLEHTINSTSRNSDGSLKFTSGVSDDQSSFSTFALDV